MSCLQRCFRLVCCEGVKFEKDLKLKPEKHLKIITKIFPQHGVTEKRMTTLNCNGESQMVFINIIISRNQRPRGRKSAVTRAWLMPDTFLCRLLLSFCSISVYESHCLDGVTMYPNSQIFYLSEFWICIYIFISGGSVIKICYTPKNDVSDDATNEVGTTP